GTPSWIGSDWLQPGKAILHVEVLSDQLTRWCCIDRLSSQRLSGNGNHANKATFALSCLERTWRLLQVQPALMWSLHISISGSGEIFNAPAGTGMHEQREDIGCNSHGNPGLTWSIWREGPTTHAARNWNERRRNLRQFWKWRSVFVVSVECAGADTTALQLLAPSNLIGKPMETARSVRVKLLQVCHLANFRWNADETA